MSIIQANNITKYCMGHLILNDIHLSVDRGRTVGIVSNDKNSKTHLLKILSGENIPDLGTLLVDGKELSDDGYPPDNMGILIDEPGFVRSFSGFKNLKYLAEINGNISDLQIAETMRFVGLNPNSIRKVCNFSYTMYKKLCIAQTIIGEKDIILLDNPFEHLTVKGIYDVRNIIYSLRFYNKTVLLTCSCFEYIQDICDDIYILENTKLSHAD